ncbi:hypothetical protein [Kitasatospora sp. NPDC093806]|uniref:hypothetical protein n=1 Tax=Kitasatospora sp. NPDC093806 TaxID=3155075 RepID=UPI00343222B2
MTTPEDHWLATQHAVLVEDLADTLDLGAGLRDIRIFARHQELVTDLGHTLDLEAGLAAIRPEAKPSTPQGEPQVLRQPAGSLRPQQRLRLRRNPAIVRGVRDVILLQATEISLDVALLLTNRAAIDYTQSRVRDLSHQLRVAKRRGIRVPQLYGRTEDLLEYLQMAEHHSRIRGIRSLALQSTLRLALDLVLNISDRHEASSEQVLRLRRLIVSLSEVASVTLNPDEEIREGLSHLTALSAVLSTTLASMLDMTAGTLSGQGSVPDLCTIFLDGTLDDFTDADLTDIDLTGVDLTGVHWTPDGTRWPSTVDIEQLRAESVETPPGSGVFVVRPGTARAEASWV